MDSCTLAWKIITPMWTRSHFSPSCSMISTTGWNHENVVDYGWSAPWRRLRQASPPLWTLRNTVISHLPCCREFTLTKQFNTSTNHSQQPATVKSGRVIDQRNARNDYNNSIRHSRCSVSWRLRFQFTMATRHFHCNSGQSGPKRSTQKRRKLCLTRNLQYHGQSPTTCCQHSPGQCYHGRVGIKLPQSLCSMPLAKIMIGRGLFTSACSNIANTCLFKTCFTL